jgi:hypothetical protein
MISKLGIRTMSRIEEMRNSKLVLPRLSDVPLERGLEGRFILVSCRVSLFHVMRQARADG